MATESLVLSSDRLKLVPFPKRWELLRPELERLFLDERRSYAYLQNEMKNKYDFDAK